MHFVILPGDGIGPEITQSTIRVMETVDQALSLGIDYEIHDIGLSSLKSSGTTAPPRVLERCKAADGIVLGPVSHLDYPPRAEGGINISAELRITLDLYANVRPSRSRSGLPHYGRTEIDLVIVRENTEGFYSDRNMHLGIGEFMPTPDLALSIRKVSAQASNRIARTAFELAMTRRKKVTAVHKVNVLKVSEALFLREVRAVAGEFPQVTYDEQLVDSMAALLVRDAQRFDVVLTTNMFGDILSDEAAELSGSIGLGGAINAGRDHCMAQAQHGSAPDIEGQDKANPTSLILSAAMMFHWLAARRGGDPKLARAGAVIEESIDVLIADPARRTRDLGGGLGTVDFTRALCEEMQERLAR